MCILSLSGNLKQVPVPHSASSGILVIFNLCTFINRIIKILQLKCLSFINIFFFKGTYNPQEGVKEAGDCLPCPPGKFCNVTGLSTPSGDCMAGFLCQESSSNPAPNDGVNGPCPEGHYCIDGNIVF